VLMLNKPLGVTCSRKDPGRVVYDLLPPRYNVRTPALSSVGGSIAIPAACCCSLMMARCCTGSSRRRRR
jgi:16S rRNA uridine-516 pseudouridylate synthase and related pseudouridylate synthases